MDMKITDPSVPLSLSSAVIPSGAAAGDQVTQTEGAVSLSQGDPVSLNCTYDSSYSVFPFWYVQRPGGAPGLFLRDVGRQESDEGTRRGFEATHKKSAPKSFHLWKSAGEWSDSGTYYCAVSDTVTRGSRGAAQEPRSGAGGGRWREGAKGRSCGVLGWGGGIL